MRGVKLPCGEGKKEQDYGCENVGLLSSFDFVETILEHMGHQAQMKDMYRPYSPDLLDPTGISLSKQKELSLEMIPIRKRCENSRQSENNFSGTQFNSFTPIPHIHMFAYRFAAFARPAKHLERLLLLSDQWLHYISISTL